MTDESGDNRKGIWGRLTGRSGTDSSASPREGWERDALIKIATASLQEHRRSRRWGIFIKLLVIAYLFLVLVVLSPGLLGEKPKATQRHTALVDVNGLIADGASASADVITTGLRKAFENEHAEGVIIRINSPGGSPVQAGYIYDEIRRLREKHPDMAVYAVITDVSASGGYYVAAAADEIYANEASIVGSIGVMMPGFGFSDALEKLGIERRLLTAGEHKGFMDPFSPARDADMQHVQTMLDDIHNQFIERVRAGRGDRLQDDVRIFSGLIWTGEQSLELGLVDAFGSPGYVAREVIGAEDIVDYTPKRTVFERFADRVGTAFAQALQRAALGGSGLR